MSDQYSYSPTSSEAVKILPYCSRTTPTIFASCTFFLLTVGTTLIAGTYLMLIHEATSPISVDPFRFLLAGFNHPSLLHKGIAYAGTIMVVFARA